MKSKDNLLQKISLKIPIDLIFHIISFLPRKRDKFKLIMILISKQILYCTLIYILLSLLTYLIIGKVNYLLISLNFLIAYYLFIFTILKVILLIYKKKK
jgi:hypothetical protein